MRHINKRIIQFFSSLADKTRLSILVCLAEKPKTVGEIHNCIGKDRITLSAVSHQLKHLGNLDIVVYARHGRKKVFRLSDNFCWCILRDAFNHFRPKCKCKECLKIRREKTRRW
jgi:DNA-binding transcriptional ArsR family regulator